MDGSHSGSIALIFAVAKFVIDLTEVSTENKVFSRLIHRVHLDLQEALRLLTDSSVQERLAADCDEEAYISGCIESTRTALADIGGVVESVRLDAQQRGSISLANRASWILKHQSKLTSRQYELDACHKSLLQVMSRLQQWKDGNQGLLPSYDDAVEEVLAAQIWNGAEVFESPLKRRMKRETMKSRNSAEIKALDHEQDIKQSVQIEGPVEVNSVMPNPPDRIHDNHVEPLGHHAGPVPSTLEDAAFQQGAEKRLPRRMDIRSNTNPLPQMRDLERVLPEEKEVVNFPSATPATDQVAMLPSQSPRHELKPNPLFLGRQSDSTTKLDSNVSGSPSQTMSSALNVQRYQVARFISPNTSALSLASATTAVSDGHNSPRRFAEHIPRTEGSVEFDSVSFIQTSHSNRSSQEPANHQAAPDSAVPPLIPAKDENRRIGSRNCSTEEVESTLPEAVILSYPEIPLSDDPEVVQADRTIVGSHLPEVLSVPYSKTFLQNSLQNHSSVTTAQAERMRRRRRLDLLSG